MRLNATTSMTITRVYVNGRRWTIAVDRSISTYRLRIIHADQLRSLTLGSSLSKETTLVKRALTNLEMITSTEVEALTEEVGRLITRWRGP